MNNNKKRIVGDDIECSIESIDRHGNSTIWRIKFPKYKYDFLKKHVGDVHLWAAEQRALIVSGQMPGKHPIMAAIRRGEKPTQRAIGDAIRFYATLLMPDSFEDV